MQLAKHGKLPWEVHDSELKLPKCPVKQPKNVMLFCKSICWFEETEIIKK